MIEIKSTENSTIQLLIKNKEVIEIEAKAILKLNIDDIESFRVELKKLVEKHQQS